MAAANKDARITADKDQVGSSQLLLVEGPTGGDVPLAAATALGRPHFSGDERMLIHKVNDRVKFSNQDRVTGTIVGHGTMMTSGGSTILTYAIRLDEQFRGYISGDHNINSNFISTLLVCADGVTKI